jgi:SulP family sulfate permease
MIWLPKSVVCLSYYDRFRFRSDLFASFVLSLQIFPICIAIAIASGLPPSYGICSAAIASFVSSAFGDSKIRVGAPNVIFVAVAANVVMRDGVAGLALSTLFAAVLLIFFGAIRVGRAVQLLPRPIVLGFTTGIAVLIVGKQIPDLLGLSMPVSNSGVPWSEPLTAFRHVIQFQPQAILLAFATLALTLASRRISRLIPMSLIIVVAGMLLVKFGHVPVRTVEAFNGPKPWLLQPANVVLRSDLLAGILAQAFVIAVLVAIESLAAMKIAEGMTGERSNPETELLVEGGANLASALFGALPVSGISSHSFDNARFGAQTPVAGILQAFWLVTLLLVAAPLAHFIPLPVISALVLSSIFGMVSWREVPRVRKASRLEVLTWIAISLLTILANLPAAISAGVVLGALLYARKPRQSGLAKFAKEARP